MEPSGSPFHPDSVRTVTEISFWVCADPRDREIGERFNRPYKESIASHVSYLFSEVLDMTLTEVHAWIARARQDADNTALKPYVEL